MLKKSTIAVLGLAASGLVSAGSMGPVCAPGNVTVPCEAKNWNLGLDALYLKTINGANRAYRLTSATAPLALGELNNDWSWAFHAQGGYQFDMGKDITVDWTHFSSDVQQSGLSGLLISPLLGARAYVATNQNRFDQVNLVMGQATHASATNSIHFYGGLQYAAIQSNITNYYAVSAAAGTFPAYTSAFRTDNSDFKGVGPVAGIDYTYTLPGGINLIANGSASLVYGTSRIAVTDTLVPTNLAVFGLYGSNKTVVPGFGGKLGLNYNYPIAQGVLNLEAGYQAMDYMNVLQALPPLAVSTATNTVSSSSFGLYGPYFGFKYTGNV